MSSSTLHLPPDFEAYGWEFESNGCLVGAVAEFEGQVVPVVFYDPAVSART